MCCCCCCGDYHVPFKYNKKKKKKEEKEVDVRRSHHHHPSSWALQYSILCSALLILSLFSRLSCEQKTRRRRLKEDEKWIKSIQDRESLLVNQINAAAAAAAVHRTNGFCPSCGGGTAYSDMTAASNWLSDKETRWATLCVIKNSNVTRDLRSPVNIRARSTVNEDALVQLCTAVMYKTGARP